LPLADELMSKDAPAAGSPLTPDEQLRYAREILQVESVTIRKLATRLDHEFCHAVALLLRCRGSLIATGMGKAGLIAQKIAATLASTGTRSHYLHPAEAFHGDLGRIHQEDVVLVLSQSGETEEIVRLIPSLTSFGVRMIAITSLRSSTLGRAADITLTLGVIEEACLFGLAPTTSTTAMLALGDALALVTSRMRNFRAEDFARFHPGGSLGRRLSKVEQHMRPLAACRLALQTATVRDVIVGCTKPGRRTGAIMLTTADGRLSGIFTDSDLARLFEQHREDALDCPVHDVMTAQPSTVPHGTTMSEAVRLMAERKISELPVVDGEGKPLGLLDITDVVGLMPADDASERKAGRKAA
jgi:arabinose-5-phosphate isomerase